MKKALKQKIAELEKKLALDFNEYKKLHPKTKKTQSDPMFAEMSQDPKKAPAQPKAPAKTSPTQAPKLKKPNRDEVRKFVVEFNAAKFAPDMSKLRNSKEWKSMSESQQDELVKKTIKEKFPQDAHLLDHVEGPDKVTIFNEIFDSPVHHGR